MPDGNASTFPAPGFDMTPWLVAQVPAFNVAMAVNRALVRRTNEAMTEWASFMLSRYREELRLQQSLMACRSPVEAQRVWIEFLQRAAEQYQREFQKFGEIATRVSGEVGGAMRMEPPKPR